MIDRPDLVLRLSALNAGQTHAFEIRPDAEVRAEVARRQGLSALRKYSFVGALYPEGKRDWRLEAKLGATVVQPCVVTLEPVSTRLDEVVVRHYVAGLVENTEVSEDEEIEMPDDDRIEPLPEKLDLARVMEEALALHVPLYPRAESAALEQSTFAEPGVAPMQDEDTKPFAGLADLKKKLSGSAENDGDAD